MKITPIVMGFAVVFMLVIAVVMGLFNLGEGNELYEDQAYRQLGHIADSKAGRVESFLDNRKADVEFLAGSKDVRDIFNEGLIGGVGSELGSFEKKKGYSDLILISSEGDVVWAAEEHDELGTNLVTGIYSGSLLAKVFDGAKKDLGVGVSDAGAYGPEGMMSVFITAPVMEVDNISGKRELRGIVALEVDGKEISELIMTDVGLGDAGEIYIINRDLNHVTPVKFRMHNHSEMKETEGIKNCFKDYGNYYAAQRGEDIEKVDKAGMYLDYAMPPNMVLGAHQYILESGWCVIAEMDEDYFLKMTPRTNISLAINISVTLIVLLFVCLVLDGFFKVKKSRGGK